MASRLTAILAVAATALVIWPPAGRDAAATGPSLYWGAWIGSQFTGGQPPWDMSALSAFERRDTGRKHVSIVHWSAPFSSAACGGPCRFDAATFERVRSSGAIPFLSWANSGIADRDVAAGRYDGYLTAWAQAAQAWGHPFFLRFDWEMNAAGFSWAVGRHGNSAADYVAAWRHVHHLLRRVPGVTWVWCPNVSSAGSASLGRIRTTYPGDGYVDWTCLDGYNGNVPWTSFADLFGLAYRLITRRVAPSKPMILAEVGTTESGGSKASWIKGMFAALATAFPKVRGLLWFDKYESGPGRHSDWPVETSSSSTHAFAAGIRAPAFATNRFSSLPLRAVRPPGG